MVRKNLSDSEKNVIVDLTNFLTRLKININKFKMYIPKSVNTDCLKKYNKVVGTVAQLCSVSTSEVKLVNKTKKD